MNCLGECLLQFRTVVPLPALDFDILGDQLPITPVDQGADEYREQTAPPTLEDGTFRCNWHVVTGETYRFEASSDLLAGNWTNLSGIVTASAPMTTIPDWAGMTTRFYRAVFRP